MLLLKNRAFPRACACAAPLARLSLFIAACASMENMYMCMCLSKKLKKHVDAVMQQCSTQVPRVPRCPLHTAVCRWPPSIAHISSANEASRAVEFSHILTWAASTASRAQTSVVSG
jgi:hypothetical protein